MACSGSGAALLSFIFIYISRFVSFYVYGLFRKQFAAAPTPSMFPVCALHCKVDSTELLICLCYTLTPSLSLPPSVFACVRVLCVYVDKARVDINRGNAPFEIDSVIGLKFSLSLSVALAPAWSIPMSTNNH